VTTPKAVHSEIISGTLDSIYLILGDDEHEAIELANEFEQVVDESLRPFNIERFDGADSSLSVGMVLNATQILPMMSPRRVVVVVRAETLLEPKRQTEAANRDIESLLDYIEDPVESTTLVLVAGRLNRTRKVAKKLFAKARVVQCGGLETVQDAQRWIRARLKSEGCRMSAGGIRLLGERVGPDIARLRDAIERLTLFAEGQSELSEADVVEVVSPGAAHDDWAVTNAIERGAVDVALRELGVTLESGAVPYQVLGQLAWVARSRIPAARSATAVDAVFRADRALKLSAGEPRILLERLVVELCGAGTRGGLR
jgi:DNA polymerase-3 subunit delta